MTLRLSGENASFGKQTVERMNDILPFLGSMTKIESGLLIVNLDENANKG
jgi:hypothetical protein